MFRLPMLFIATGILSFIVYQLLSLLSLGTWMFEPIRNPEGWFRMHLLILDWATMIAMGAVYQLMDVVLQRRIYSVTLGYLHYAAFAAGTLLLLAGFITMYIPVLAAGAIMTFLGMVIFVFNVGYTMLQAQQWNTVTISTAFALVYSIITGGIGTLMGLNFAFPIWLEGHDRLLAAHIWIGMIGWFALLITGFSYKMLPMFFLSHGHSTKLQIYIIALLNAGIITGTAAFLLGGGSFVQAISITLIVAAFLLYTVHIGQIRKHRNKRNPGRGIWWTVQSARGLTAIGVLLLVGWLLDPAVLSRQQTTVLIGMAFLWGWVAVTILGYLSKIVPFLWWTRKYGPKAGQANVPAMSSLLPDRLVHYGLLGIVSGVVLTLGGIYLDLRSLVGAGGTAMAMFSLMYISLIARVFTK